MRLGNADDVHPRNSAAIRLIIRSVLFIENGLARDEESETLEILIDGVPCGSASVDRKRPKAAKLPIELGPGFHRYELRGVAAMRDGRQMPITGSGLVAAHDHLWPRFQQAEGLVEACRAVFGEAPGLGIVLDPVSDADVAAAEERLGRTLPRVYRQEVMREGAFKIRVDDNFVCALHHPRRIKTAQAWHEELFDEDIVVGTLGLDILFYYREGKRCPDGEPSFGSEALSDLEPDSCTWGSYVSDLREHCDWNWYMKGRLYGELVEQYINESVAVSGDGFSIYRTHEQPSPDELRMYLRGPWRIDPF